jgi:outer membrane cobalamin receptor
MVTRASRVYSALTALSLVVGAAGPAGAQPAGDAVDITDVSLEDLLDPNITTASRIAERATDAPATVYVISKADIRQRGYSVLSDVLKDLPGMETSEHYYSEQGTLVPVRGVVGNNKIVLLVNGMRVNPPGGEDLILRNDLSVRAAEQIEIIYGPGSTLYGQDAISAVINIKTRKPGDPTVEALAGYGLNNTMEGFASFGTRLREDSDVPVSLTGYVAAQRSDLTDLKSEFPDWWRNYQPLVGPLGRDEAVRSDMGINAFARLEARTASLQAWYRESARSSTEGSGEGGKMPVLYWVDEARWRDRALVVEGQHQLRLSSRLTLSSILVLNRYQIDPESRYVFPDGAGGLFLRDFKYGTGSGETLEEKLDVELGESTRLVMGLLAGNYDVVPKVTVLDGADTRRSLVPQAGILTYYTDPAMTPASRVDINRANDFHYQHYGAYVEGSHRFTEAVRAIAGVRLDHNTRYDAIPVSPRAALILRGLDQRLTLKYVFSMAYVSPAPYFGNNIFDNGVQISAGNPDLEPERALSNEVNVTWQAGGLLASASGYFNHQSDLLITAQSEAPETEVAPVVFVQNPDGTTGTRRVARSINLGSSNAYGLDLSARYSSERLSGWASYSYVDFDRTLNGRHSGLDQISRHNVRAGVTVHLLPGLSLTPSLVLRSTPENLPMTYDDMGVSLAHPYEINVNALYSPFDGLDVFLTGRNITYHHYAVRGVSGPAIQEPLRILGGVRWRR